MGRPPFSLFLPFWVKYFLNLCRFGLTVLRTVCLNIKGNVSARIIFRVVTALFNLIVWRIDL